MTSTQLQIASRPLAALVQQNTAAIESALHGKPLVLAEFVAALDNAVAMSKELATCLEQNPDSVKNAILSAAFLGLRPDRVHKHYALTAFKSSRHPSGWECVGIPEWRGLVHIANDAGSLATPIRAACVFEYEVKPPKGQPVRFDYDPTTEEITHNPLDLSGEFTKLRTPDKLVAAYATCRVKGRDGWATTVLDRRGIERRRAKSASFKFSPKTSAWTTDTEPMWIKSAIRAHLDSGKVPMSRDILTELHKADEREAEAEAEVFKPADAAVVVDREDMPDPAEPQQPDAEPEKPKGKGKAKKAQEPKGRRICYGEKPPEDTSAIWRRKGKGGEETDFECVNGTWGPVA